MLDSGETISHIAIFRLRNRIRIYAIYLKVLTCEYIPYSYEYNSTRTSTCVLYAIFWVSISIGTVHPAATYEKVNKETEVSKHKAR